MADLIKQTLAPSTPLTLTGLTEHGKVGVGISGGRSLRIEQELDTDIWATIASTDSMKVVEYVGTKLRFTNEGPTTLYLRVGQK